MGLLSNFGNSVIKAVTAPVAAVVKAVAATPAAVVKAVAPVMNTATVAFVHPIQTVAAVISPTKTVSQVVEKHFSKPLPKQITETVITTAGYATAVLGTAAVAAKGVAASAAALIPATIKGKVIAAVAAPVIIGAVVNKPAETLQAAASLPSALGNVGGNIANLVADPSISNVKALVTENPVIVGAGVAAAAVLGAKAILPAIATARQTEAIQEQTKAIEASTAGITSTPSAPTTIKTGETIYPSAPVTPKTERVVTTSTGKKRKSKAKPTQNISQRVNVIVANKANSTGIRQTSRYLNKELLINR